MTKLTKLDTGKLIAYQKRLENATTEQLVQEFTDTELRILLIDKATRTMTSYYLFQALPEPATTEEINSVRLPLLDDYAIEDFLTN